MQNTLQSYFKEDFAPSCNPADGSANRFAMPVNNFLKDHAQIEREIAEEITRNKEFCICMDGRYVPVSEILNMPMEENY